MVGPATLDVHGLSSNETAVSAQRSWRIVAERQPGSPGSSAASGEPCKCSESSTKETAPPHIAREPPAPPPLPAPAWLSPSSDLRVPSPEDAILFRSVRSIRTTNGPLWEFLPASPARWSRARPGRGDNKRALFCLSRLPAAVPRSVQGSRSGPRKNSQSQSDFSPLNSYRRRLPGEGSGHSEQRNGRGSKQISQLNFNKAGHPES